ncbi:MAG: helix-turn-helix transcriptional regulator [Rhodospirillaceae bacterium]
MDNKETPSPLPGDEGVVDHSELDAAISIASPSIDHDLIKANIFTSPDIQEPTTSPTGTRYVTSEKVRAALKANWMTVVTLSVKTGIPVNTIKGWFNRNKRDGMRPERLRAIAQVLGPCLSG